MSLIDPVAERRERQVRKQTAGWSVPAAALLLGMVLAFAVGGVVVGKTLELDGDVDSGGFFAVATATFLCSIPLLLTAWFTLSVRKRLPGAVGFALGVIALGLGLDSASQQSWPAFVWLFGLLVIGICLLAAMRRESVSRRIATTRAAGWETTATLTDLDRPQHEAPTSRGALAMATFSFNDVHGTQRWVQRPMVVRRNEEFPVGTLTRVWCPVDGSGGQGAIVVELSEQHSLYEAR